MYVASCIDTFLLAATRMIKIVCLVMCCVAVVYLDLGGYCIYGDVYGAYGDGYGMDGVYGDYASPDGFRYGMDVGYADLQRDKMDVSFGDR